MIYPDVNLLLYAYDEKSPFHTRALNWLEEVLSTQQVFFSWHTITGFLRLITHPAASASPLTIEKAVWHVGEWLENDNAHLVFLEKKNWPLFSSILIDSQVTGNLVMDAHVAAMAAACGADIATADRDFSRFPNSRSFNPLRPLEFFQ